MVKLLPCPNHPDEIDLQHAIRFGPYESFDLSTEDDKLLTKEGVSCHHIS